jgi:hypothetical protein
LQLEHTPEAIDAWGTTLRTRCTGHPVAGCLERDTGPLGSAWRTYDFRVLFPIHPLTLARSRAAFTLSRATDDPTDAALQLALLLPHRDTRPPLTPPSATLRALTPRVAHRRRVGGDTGRMTHRLTRTLKHYGPHVRHWLQDKDPPIFGDFLRRWPTLKAVPLARRSTLESFVRDQHGRSPKVSARRLQASRAALPRTTDAGGIAPHALLGPALVAPLRVTWQARTAFDTAIAQRAQSHPDCPRFQALPGASPVCASRLLVAFGAQRARSPSATALQKDAGIAPVTARSGTKAWGHWRLQGPKCLRPSCVAWAAASIRHAFWAQVYDQQQRDKGQAPQAAVRALAFQWLRILYRCGHERTPYDEATSLQALTRRGSSLSHHLAKAS